MYADRVVMLHSLQKRILKEFHTGHPGMSRMKSLMRSYTYWPHINQDIEKRIKECRSCQQAAKAPPIKTLHWPKTDIPWTGVHIDYAGPLKGYYYLIIWTRVAVSNSIVFSKWPEIYKFRHFTSSNTIKAMDEIFSRSGVPDILVSENGTMFMDKEFKDYCSSLATEHITTPAYNLRSKENIKKEPRARYGRTLCTEIFCCIQDHTKSKHKFKTITCRTNVFVKDKIHIRQVTTKAEKENS